MTEEKNSDFQPRQHRAKQHISVPFCWEEGPGRPKDRSLISAPVHPIPFSTTKLAASVPFKWEEKPGTPLAQFAHAPLLEPLVVPLVHTGGSSPKSPHKDQWRNNPFVGAEEGGAMLDLDTEAFPFDTENSGCNELPGEESGKCETWDSDSTNETDSQSDSSGSEAQKSVDNVSILEFLFPLSSPEVSFLNEVWYREKVNPAPHPEPTMKNNSKSQCNHMVKRAPTLGELILLSRRLSCGKKNPIPERKIFSLAPWRKFTRKRVHICGLFGTGVNQSITQDAANLKDA